MKITKYPQSCFMLEAADKNILIDPGILAFDPVFADEWKKADAILITHKHTDHCHEKIIKDIPVPIYSSAEVAAKYPDLKITAVKAGDEFQPTDGIGAVVTNAVHGWLPPFKYNGKAVYQAVGFIINAQGKQIWFTGDTICFDNDYKCDVLCAPISGLGLVMSPFEVAYLAKECGAKLVIPCHADNPDYPVDMEKMKETFKTHDINYRILATKESMDL